jgi:tetratricopeptide (TPR) repeat protein
LIFSPIDSFRFGFRSMRWAASSLLCFLFIPALLHAATTIDQKNRTTPHAPIWNEQLDNQSVVALMRQAVSAYQMGELHAAMDLINAAQREMPSAWGISAASAKVLVEMREYDQALVQLRNMEEIKPGDFDTLKMTGYCYEQTGKVDEALTTYRHMKTIKPESTLPYYYAGNVYFAQNHQDRAIEEYELAAALNPSNTEARVALATVYLKAKRFSDAAENYRNAIDLDPQLAEAYSQLGTALYLQKYTDEAIRHARHAVELAPDRSEYYNNLASMLARSGDLTQAGDWLKQALDLNILDPQTWTTVLDLVDAYVAKHSTAPPALEPAGLPRPARAHWAREEAEKALAENNPLMAARYLSIAARSDSSQPAYFAQLGMLLLSTPISPLGDKCLELALLLQPNNPQLHTLVSQLKSARYLEQNPNLLSDLNQQLQIEPENVDLRMRYAELLEMNGAHTNALAEYQKIIEHAPTNILARIQLSSCYYRNGELNSAINQLITCFDYDLYSAPAWQYILQSIETSLPLEQLNQSLPVPENTELDARERAQWHYYTAFSPNPKQTEELHWAIKLRHMLTAIKLDKDQPFYFLRAGILVKQHLSARLALPFSRVASNLSGGNTPEIEDEVSACLSAAQKEHLSATLVQARTLHQRGETAAALELINQAIVQNPGRPELLFQHGWLLLELAGDQPEKIQQAIKALQLAQQATTGVSPAILHQTLAQAYYRLGQPKQALESAIIAAKTAKNENNTPLVHAIIEEAKVYRQTLDDAPR